MPRRKDFSYRPPRPVERRKIKPVEMSPKPWLPEGREPAPVKVFTRAEVAAWVAAQEEGRA